MAKRVPRSNEGNPSFTPPAVNEGLQPLIAKIQDIDHALDELRGLISLQREHVLKDLSKITLLTRRQAAELLAMSESQLDRATQQGTLSAINHDRRPRYSLEDIKVFIASRRAEKRRQRP